MSLSCFRKRKIEPEIRLKKIKEKLKLKSQKNSNEIYSLTSNLASPQLQSKPKHLERTLTPKYPETCIESVLSTAGALGSGVASYSSLQLFKTVADDDEEGDDEIFKDVEFPFENLVFEGGGNKGMAYVGALKVCSLIRVIIDVHEI